MNEVQQILGKLRAKGWTWAAVADELGTHYNTVQKWFSGDREPANKVVLRELERLLTRKKSLRGGSIKEIPQPHKRLGGVRNQTPEGAWLY